jgi:hypothetical protein
VALAFPPFLSAESSQRDRSRILSSIGIDQRRTVNVLTNGLFYDAARDRDEISILA